MDFNKVFISYVGDDYNVAEQIYNLCERNGLDPWLDRKKLKAGQDWDLYIQDALKKSDFIIILFSSVSAVKRSFYQKELKMSLRLVEDKLPTDIFIIPVKTEVCEIPDSFSKYQYLNSSLPVFQDDIFSAIETQRSTYIEHERLKQESLDEFCYQRNSETGTYGEKSPRMICEFELPEFKHTKNQSLKELNTLFRQQIIAKLIRCRDSYFENLIDLNKSSSEEEILLNNDSTLSGTIVVQKINQYFISFTSFYSEYHTGAAHGFYWTEGYNFHVSPLRSFSLKDLFEDFNSAIPILRNAVLESILAGMEMDNNLFQNDIEDTQPDLELLPVAENFENYYFDENGITFVYNPYAIGPYSMGMLHGVIVYDKLKKLFLLEKQLINFIDKITDNS